MTTNTICYEHALGDHTRVCLRLESLFRKLKVCQRQPKAHSHYFAIQTLLHLLNLLDRPDLKGKLLTALQQHENLMAHWQTNPDVNQEALEHLLSKLRAHSHQLKTTTHLPGFELTQHPFIKMLRQQSNHPGGLASDALPCYQYWLSNPSRALTLIEAWQATLQPLADTVELLLSLTRQSRDMQEKVAEDGLYKQPLDPEQDLSLIRIETFDDVYPEFSVGKHQLVIYFFRPTLSASNFDSHVAEKVCFKLGLC